MNFALISHPDCLLHVNSVFHPEQPARIQVIEDEIYNSKLRDNVKKYLSPLAQKKHLLRVHDKEYADGIFSLSPPKKPIMLDLDTTMSSYTLQAALRAAGSVVHAVDLVMSNEVKVAFCNVRPPGHHATRNKAMGFCIFNNVAVGVAHAFEEYKLKRILIFDFDVHHGNGTEDIFTQNNKILMCSIFQFPFYPFTGPIAHKVNIIHIPLPPGTSGEQYLKIVYARCSKLVKAFKPEVVFFSAGFDAHSRESIASLNLNETDYGLLTIEVRKMVEESCRGRFISVLEGGYNLEVLGECVTAHLNSLVT